LRNPSLTPATHLDSQFSAPQPEAPDSFSAAEQNIHIQELQGEVSTLKKQLLVALGK
jgi:hypothetical protein